MFVEHKEVGEDKKLDDASRLLLRAADLIESKGWIQGQSESDGGFCIQGVAYTLIGG